MSPALLQQVQPAGSQADLSDKVCRWLIHHLCVDLETQHGNRYLIRVATTGCTTCAFYFSVRQAAYLLCENLSATGAASAPAGVLPALQAKFSLRCGKSRQRQTTSCVQVIWDKTLLSHCRVIYLSRNMLQQVQPASEVRVLSLPGPTGTRPRDGYLFKDFFIQKYRLQQVQPAWVGRVLLPSAAKWFTVFIKTGKDSNLSRVFAYKMIR